MNGELGLAALFGLALVASGCSAEAQGPAGDPEDTYDAPALAVSTEDLSSIDCGEHGDTGYTQGSPFPITVVTVDGKPVETATANAYYVMAQAAAAAGVNLQVVSGFRTMAEQQYLYSCYVNCSCNSCNLAAKPGYSNHQSGHALDLNTSAGGVYAWLDAHAGAYGFTRTVPSENWHWEWWGGGPGGGPCGTCTPHCEGSKIIGQDCGVGDCGAYGATCADDAKGVRCVSVFCPALGQKKVCVNDQLIGDCNDGAISTGDCSAYGAKCVDDAKGARCSVVFCADQPATAHDVCIPNGQLGHCNDIGGLTVEDCALPCTTDADGSHCGKPAEPSPPPAGSGGAGPSGGAGGGAGTGTGGSGWQSGKPISASSGGAHVAPPANDAVEGGCGCRAASQEPRRRGALGWLVALAAAISLRRRARAPSAT